MAQNEFAIIEQYFSDIGVTGDGIALGIGDDAAVVDVARDRQLVVSMDTLISGIHFPVDTSPADIAYKALAVNLSDLAAMAATPAWFLMSLTLPHSETSWLQQFSRELSQVAKTFRLPLIGGDTCHGELSISIQITGEVPADQYVTRQGAAPGDLILVSGELGNAALGLSHLQHKIELPQHLQDQCLSALNRPNPRLELVPFLRAFASAAIDVSDGLQGDLTHILKASGCGARLDQAALPVNSWIEQQGNYGYALAAGDDYEICCCVPSVHRAEIELWNREHPKCPLSVVGEITESGYVLQQTGSKIDLENSSGYQHFV